MNFQTISSSSTEPASKPLESWKIKLLPGYVIWCSISCRPLCHSNPMGMGILIHHYLTHLNWWHQMSHRSLQIFTFKGVNIWRQCTKSCLTHHPCHIWWALSPLLHHRLSQGWSSCLHWPFQWQGYRNMGICIFPYVFEHHVSHLYLIC